MRPVGPSWLWLRFGSKYSTLSWVFRKGRIVGISWRWFPRPRSSSVVVRDFCSLTVQAHHCRIVSSSVHWKFVSYRFSSTPAILPVFLRSIANAPMLYLNSKSGVRENGKRLLSDRKRRKRSMAAPRWISLMNFCKLTVCHLSSSQMCKTSSEKHSVLLLTFLYRFWKFGATRTSKPFSNIKVKIVVVV